MLLVGDEGQTCPRNTGSATGIYDKGVNGSKRMERINRIAPRQVDQGHRNESSVRDVVNLGVNPLDPKNPFEPSSERPAESSRAS